MVELGGRSPEGRAAPASEGLPASPWLLTIPSRDLLLMLCEESGCLLGIEDGGPVRAAGMPWVALGLLGDCSCLARGRLPLARRLTGAGAWADAAGA